MSDACPKCPSGRFSPPTYCSGAGGCLSPGCGMGAEHLSYRCETCGYVRTTPCADADTSARTINVEGLARILQNAGRIP